MNVESRKVRQNSLFTFISLVVLAFVVSNVPFINVPFSWMQTYFHEISHGLAAIFTGGLVKSIELHLIGSGLCTTQGGTRFIVAFSGYSGAVLWGALIYTMVDNVNKKSAIFIATVMICMILLSALFWARDFITLCIMGLMLIPFLVVLNTQNQLLVKFFLQFLGLYVLLDAIKSPLNLIDGKYYGDGNTLAELTGIPEIFWVVVWFCAGLFTLYMLWKKHVKRTPVAK